MIPEFEVEILRKQLAKLQELGYVIKYGSNSYQVWYKDEYVSGAGSLPRDKPKHWKHRVADTRMHLKNAVITAQQDYERRKNDISN